MTAAFAFDRLVEESVAAREKREAEAPRAERPIDADDRPPPNGPDDYGAARLVPDDGRRFDLVAFEEIKHGATPTYLVRELIPRDGLVVVWGPPKCGKSFWTFDVVMHIALGWPYRGRRVRQGPIVYCALEGGAGFRRRVEAFRLVKLAEAPDGVPFYLISSPVSLVADHPALIAAVRATLGQVMPVAVVIDTLNRSLAGSESDDRDMALYIQSVDAIRSSFGCVVVVVHHCGHERTRPRGHSSLLGAADAQISVKRDPADNIVTTVEWMKDGPQGDEIVSRLRQVDIGIDEDGEPITSCVVDEVEGADAPARKAARPRPLSPAAKIALSALNEAVLELGAVPPASSHIPAATKTVTKDQWRDYAFRRGISGSGKERAPRMAFGRASDALLAARRVAIWDQNVRIV
jgi:hypothetical protein